MFKRFFQTATPEEKPRFDGETTIDAEEVASEPQDMSQARLRIYHLATAYNDVVSARRDARLGTFAACGLALGLLVVCGIFFYQNLELSNAYYELLFNGR